MTQPRFAPILKQHEVREVQRIAAPAPWTAHRPGERRPAPQLLRQAGLGIPGPDQGYALALAARFEDRLVLEPGERAEDVLAGAVAIALGRAAIFGRAPVAADIELALGLFKYLVGDEGTWPSGELVALRRERFAAAARSCGQGVAGAAETGGSDLCRIADLLIAAIAHSNGLVPYTRDRNDSSGLDDPVRVIGV